MREALDERARQSLLAVFAQASAMKLEQNLLSTVWNGAMLAGPHIDHVLKSCFQVAESFEPEMDQGPYR